MKFINTLGNTVRLHDIDKIIPFVGDEPQELSPDLVNKSGIFQSFILDGKFKIVSVTDDRIEQNLLRAASDVAYPPPVVSNAEVVFKGHFHSHTGYAKANRNLAFSLARLGMDIGIDPVGNRNEGLNEMEVQQLNMLLRPRSERAIQIHSTIPSFSTCDSYRYRILNTTVETGTIPQQFVECCNGYDEVWTVSDWCKGVLERHKVFPPVKVIPNSVDTGLYNERVKPHRFIPSLKPFVFVSVFGWNWRKGYDTLLRAYLREFTANDPVTLLLISRYQYEQGSKRRYKIEGQIREFVKQYGGNSPAHVARCGRSVPEFEMPRLYRACNCFVLPSRGEGFGLPYMEASLCGLPVIATRHGGQLMFLNDDNSFLLDVDYESPENSEQTGIHFWTGQPFPQLTSEGTIKELGTLMRRVYEEYDAALGKNTILKTAVAKGYNCGVVAKNAEKRLDEIWCQIG